MWQVNINRQPSRAFVHECFRSLSVINLIAVPAGKHFDLTAYALKCWLYQIVRDDEKKNKRSTERKIQNETINSCDRRNIYVIITL